MAMLQSLDVRACLIKLRTRPGQIWSYLCIAAAEAALRIAGSRCGVRPCCSPSTCGRFAVASAARLSWSWEQVWLFPACASLASVAKSWFQIATKFDCPTFLHPRPHHPTLSSAPKHIPQVALQRAHSMWRRANCSDNCTFLHLDWRQPLTATPIAASASAPGVGSGNNRCVSGVDLIIASDVAYEPSLTQAFFIALRALLLAAAPHATALVALERRVNFSVSVCDVVALDADVLADVREIRVLRFRSSMCAPAANHLHQFATGCGCDKEGNVMNGFSGRKVYGAALNKHRAMPSVTV